MPATYGRALLGGGARGTRGDGQPRGQPPDKVGGGAWGDGDGSRTTVLRRCVGAPRSFYFERVLGLATLSVLR